MLSSWRRIAIGVAGLAVLVGCAAEQRAALTPVTPSPTGVASRPVATPMPSPTPSATVPSATTPSAATPPERTWTVGASPLPTRADGFGVVLDTPPELVDRQLPTVDRLPPPLDGQFHSEILQVDPLIRERMGETWNPDCPVGLDQLRYLTVTFWGFDNLPHTGELVVNATVAADVVDVFRRLHQAHFPIEEMRLVTTADVEAAPTGDSNNTSAYYCRPAVGQTSGWSAHAYGLAIDINPFHNPYVRGDLVIPELASAYVDRGRIRPGMVRSDDVVVQAFRDIGWKWGGDFQTLKDYMHFSQTGE